MNFILENWGLEDHKIFINYLFTLQDKKYKEFHSKIIPGLNNVIGIRMPILRTIAKDIVKGNWKSYLTICKDQYYEELMIQALIIGIVKVDYQSFLKIFDTFVNKIDNWGICDSFCAGLKRSKLFHNDFYNYLSPYISSTNPWYIRTCLVIMLFHYIDEEHIHDILNRCDNIECDDYYVKMATAWLISICYIKYPEPTHHYLSINNKLDKWTFNKAIQKIRESRRISANTKAVLNTLKRT